MRNRLCHFVNVDNSRKDSRCIMKRYVLAILLALMLPGATWGKTPDFVPRESIALVFSSTVHGELEPCG